MPESCAPFLSFTQKIYYEGIKNIKEEYDWENDDFVGYLVIGSGDNVSICVNTEKGDQTFQIDFHHVYRVNMKEDTDCHEEYVPIMIMNSSIGHLAHCLLAYQKFVENLRSVRNNQSFLEIQPSTQELNSPRKNLLDADQNCLREKSYWWFELEGFNTTANNQWRFASC